MEEGGTTCASEDRDPPLIEIQPNGDIPERCDVSTDSEGLATSGSTIVTNDESGVVLESVDDCNKNVTVESSVEQEPCEVNDDARSLGDLDSLPAGDELVLGAAGSDSGVEGCGRALSSGGGSRSCASSVVSCGSGCGSESSSVAGAPPRPRRRVNVTVTEPKRSSPLGSSTPRPVTAPRGPNLATRERARSREKPTPPEKPRPLTPKPRIRPTGELPNLVRESPALRAKPTKTSTARCRTPNSPSEEKRWPSTGPRLTTPTDATAARVAADKYGTLPRRRRENGEADGSPKHEVTPPTSRKPTITRSVSTRTTTKTRVRIYAEKISQTVLLGTDVESALAGITPNIECVREVSRCHRGVQASSRDAEMARLAAAVAAAAAAEAAAREERERREHAEAQLAVERAARLAAIADLERNSQRLLELAGAGPGAGADGCLRALDEQLCAARELAAKQRGDIDALREHCDRLHHEACSARESARVLEARLAEAERESAEMQDFLAAETGALGDSLRDAEAELAKAHRDLERRRAECRQLVRMCEQRRQEALAAAARARSGGGAAHALDALARRLRALTDAVARAYALPTHALEPTIYHNEAFRCVHTQSGGGAAHALDALARRLRALTDAVARAYALPTHALEPTIYHNEAFRCVHTQSGGGAAHALDALARRLRALTDAVARAYALPTHALEPTIYHNEAFRCVHTQSGGGAAHALDALARRLRALTDAVARAYALPTHALEPTIYHNEAFSRSDSGEALSPESDRGGLLTAVARALRSAPPPAPASAPATPLAPAAPAAPEDDRSRISDDNDNSADLLDSETEPCLVTDPECAEEWWSGAEAGGAWSGEELSPSRESCGGDESLSERDSLRNLSAAIAHRHRSEAEDAERGSLLERVLALDNRLSELLRALRLAAAAAATTDDADSMRLAAALKDKIDLTEKNVADVVVKKLAELDASKNMMEQYRHSVETLKKQLAQTGEEDDWNYVEEELSMCSEAERRARYSALDAAVGALSARQPCVRAWPRLAALQRRLERLAFLAAQPPRQLAPHNAHAPHHPPATLHTTA